MNENETKSERPAGTAASVEAKEADSKETDTLETSGQASESIEAPAAPEADEVVITTDAAQLAAADRKWEDLGLAPEILKLIHESGYKTPTPVQSQGIPWVLEGGDLVVSAPTGTGKTAAFVLPLVQLLKGREGTYGLILAPTREIANQTKAVLDVYGAPLGVRSAVLIGGIDMRLDTAALNTYPQVIVATPGRLCDHLDRGNIWLDYLEVVILDEADRMLDMGFSDQLNRILDDTPKSRQTMLFSATFPPAVEKLARKILHEPRRITIGRSMKPTDAVEQHFIFTEEADKVREVSRILIKETGSCFVFARSKERTTNLWRSLRAKGILDAAHLHSDLRQRDREQALADFKEGKYRILVATDVMGRGIDVAGVAHVINYDLPRDPSDYIHRIGRTGRAAATGKATSLITRGDRETVEKLEKILGRPIRPGGGGGSAGAGEARSGDGGRGGEGRRDERDGGGRGGSRGGGQQRGGRGGSGGFSRGGRSDGPRAAVVGGESRGPRPVTAVQPIRADRAFAEFSAAPGESGAESSAGPVVGVGPQQSGRVGDGGDGTQRRRRRRGGRGRRKPGTDSGPVEGGGSAGGAPQGE